MPVGAMRAVGAWRTQCQVGASHLHLLRVSGPGGFRHVSTVTHAQLLPSHTSTKRSLSHSRRPTQTRKSGNLGPIWTPVRDNSTTSASSEAMTRHQEEVKRISETVKAFHERGEKFRIYHGSTNSTRKNMMNKDSRKVVDTSKLNHVLHIDKEKQVALVEPNVPMDRLVEATLEHNLIPPVVMEFPGITVGGGYSGTSGESSSFKHGFFDRTLNSVEMVLADGSVTTLSESQNADLFRGAAGAVGTFGVTTLVELQLRPARKYVETTYHPVSSTAEAIAKTKELADPAGDLDYVDGLLFSPNSGAIITGRLVDEQPSSHPLPIQRFSSASDPWFYMHAETTITNSPDPGTPHKELIPLPEYLFRYDRGGFWVGRAAFSYFSPFVPFNRFTRWWLDDFLHTRMMYQALHSSGHTERMFVQDLAVPYDGAESFIQYSDQRLNIWPLWLCPLRQSPQPSMHPHDTRSTGRGEGQDSEEGQMLNIGLWGLGPPIREDFIRANRDIETKLKHLHGMRWLYAQTYHPAEEFWEDFGEGWYRALRRKYGAEGLPDVHEKVRVGRDQATMTPSWGEWVGSFWPLPGLLGLRRAIQSRDYVKARESTWKEWVPRE